MTRRKSGPARVGGSATLLHLSRPLVHVRKDGRQDPALCRAAGQRAFFDLQGSDPAAYPTISTRLQRWYAGSRYCFGCPVMRECLRTHLDAEFGTFGGVDQGARYVVRQLQRKVVNPRRTVLLGTLGQRMEAAGYTRDEIAEHLDVSRTDLDRTVSAWCKSEEGRRRIREDAGWAALAFHHRRPAVVALATGLSGIHVKEMQETLKTFALQLKEEPWPARRTRRERTAGPVTTAA